MEERKNAADWLYEHWELDGAPVWVTGVALDHSSVPKEMFCYDVVGKEESEKLSDYWAVKEAGKEPCVASILSAGPLDFGGQERRNLRDLSFQEELPVCSLSDMMKQAQEMTDRKTEPVFSMSMGI